VPIGGVSSVSASFEGYVKPLIRNLEVAGDDENEDAPIRMIWENLVGAAAELLENQPTDQTGARVAIAGSFENPEVSIPSAVSSVLQNAILEALEPRLEGLGEPSSSD
jgi:hypothetical protein